MKNTSGSEETKTSSVSPDSRGPATLAGQAMLSNEELNLKIAELHNPEEYELGKGVIIDGEPIWIKRNNYTNSPFATIPITCLRYCSNLNAMHEAEKVMTDEQRVRFRLRLMFNSDGPKAVFRTIEAALCHATAHQRAEAVVATMLPVQKGNKAFTRTSSAAQPKPSVALAEKQGEAKKACATAHNPDHVSPNHTNRQA